MTLKFRISIFNALVIFCLTNFLSIYAYGETISCDELKATRIHQGHSPGSGLGVIHQGQVLNIEFIN